MNEAKGTNIASATSTNISSGVGVTGNYIHITGTTTITSFGTAPQAGASRTLIFDGILTLTHNASYILLPGGLNITTAVGDVATFVSENTTAPESLWKCISYTRASGKSLISTSQATAFDVTQTTHGLSVGNVIKSTGANTYGKAQANSSANAEVVGIVTVVTDANNFTFTAEGIITTGVPAQAAGTVMFLDPSTAGAMTTTETTTAGQVSKPVLVVLENGAKALVNNFRGMEIIAPANFDNITAYTIDINNALSTNLSYSGLIETSAVGENVVFGDVLYLKFSDGKWWKAKADAYATTPAQRMALASISANASGTLLIQGNVRNDAWNLTANKVYLSAATAGAITTTAPSTAGNQIQTLGTAKNADVLYFNPSHDVGEK
jgi:hypothetical protein